MRPIDARQRLIAARQRVGKTPQELAQAVGLTAAAYCDLERFDDIYDTISLGQLVRLCQQVEITPHELFTGGGSLCGPRSDFRDLAEAAKGHFAKKSLSLDDFETSVGWKLDPFPEDPEAAWTWNLDCFRAVCGRLGIEWSRALPDSVP